MKHIYITDEDYKRAEDNGVCRHTLYGRVKKSGWDKEKAITTKPFESELTPWIEKAKENGINSATFRTRVQKLKWDVEKASTTPIKHVIKVELNSELFKLFCGACSCNVFECKGCTTKQEINNILKKYEIRRCKNGKTD